MSDIEADTPTKREPPTAVELALSRIEGRLGELYGIASKCFEAVQELPILRSDVERISAELALLKRDTEAPPPGTPWSPPFDAE